MARLTIVFLLLCLCVMGYLFYERTGDTPESKTLKDRIQFLEKENEELKNRKPRAELPPPPKKEEPTKAEEKKAPVVVPPPPLKLEIKRGEPLRKN